MFLLTADLSRLARWLRLLGFDAAISSSNEVSKLLQVCQLQNRILLTRIKRNDKLKANKKVLIINSEHYGEQLKQVVQELQLREFCIFSRCLYCNRSVYPIAREKIIHRLPEKVKNRETKFTQCRKCGRLYWKGTHYERMLQTLDSLLDGIIHKNIGEFVLTDFR
ncbi:MAG: Mut7-C RNAse domain-containing protein [Candidatus Cloacimonadaceae bacterium]